MEANVRQFSSDKILKHLDRVDEWIKGKNVAPITLELDMTNLCDHRCPECSGYYSQERGAASLPWHLTSKIIKQLAKEGVRGIIFTGGGEPLCHPQIKQAVELAHRLGLDIGFITNGTAINKEIAQVLLKCCVWLRVSLDAASKRIFKKVHGLDGDSFEKVIENIKLLVQTKKKMRSKTTVGVGYLTSDYTKSEMFVMTKLCKNLGVDYLQFRPMQIHKDGKFIYHRSDISKEIAQCLIESTDTYKVLYSKHKYDMMRESNYGRNYNKCYGQQFATVIAADAKVYVCCHMRGFKKYCLGDLRKNSFSEIWDSKRREQVVRNIDFRDCIPLCRDNTFNQILWNIKQPKEHVNFL